MTEEEKARRETELNIKVPRQTRVAGKAIVFPDGRRVKESNVIYGERIYHGVQDTIERHIAIVTGDDVDEYNSTDGWYHYTLSQARGF